MAEYAHDHEAEEIELRALEALHEAADADLRAGLGLAVRDVGGGIASIAAELPASAITINRVIGLGVAQPLERAHLQTAVAHYRMAGVERFFVQIHPEAYIHPEEGSDPSDKRALLTRTLREEGLEPARGWQKFARGTEEPIPEGEAAVQTREIDASDGMAFGRIVCDAFDLGEAAVPWLARLADAPGWRAFLSLVDGEPAGAGALFIRDDVAWTDFGATAPAYRQRGVQRSSLAHRLRAALEAGCRRIHTCTGEEVPGDPQHSFANIKRCGFSESYLRLNWAPPKKS